MARISHHRPHEDKQIILFEESVRCLENNTIVYDLFNLAKKAIDEGYELVFIGQTKEIQTLIKDMSHLKNYFKMFSGVKDF